MQERLQAMQIILQTSDLLDSFAFLLPSSFHFPIFDLVKERTKPNPNPNPNHDSFFDLIKGWFEGKERHLS